MLNSAELNKSVSDQIREMSNRAQQQPISYKPLFEQALELAEQQFRRAMTAEAMNHELRRIQSESEATALSEGFKRGAEDVVKQLRAQKIVVEIKQAGSE